MTGWLGRRITCRLMLTWTQFEGCAIRLPVLLAENIFVSGTDHI